MDGNFQRLTITSKNFNFHPKIYERKGHGRIFSTFIFEASHYYYAYVRVPTQNPKISSILIHSLKLI